MFAQAVRTMRGGSAVVAERSLKGEKRCFTFENLNSVNKVGGSKTPDKFQNP